MSPEEIPSYLIIQQQQNPDHRSYREDHEAALYDMQSPLMHIGSSHHDPNGRMLVANSHVQAISPPMAAATTFADGAGTDANGRFKEQWDVDQRGDSVINGLASRPNRNSFTNVGSAVMSSRPQSYMEGDDALDLHKHGRPKDRERDRDSLATTTISLPERRNTLKKKASLRRSGSLKRSSSRRSMRAGSVRSLALQSSLDPDELYNVFHCPVPTSGNPTDGLANRFQAWRKILKDLVAYFRELSAYDEQRLKSLTRLVNVSSAMAPPADFLCSGGLEKAADIVRSYNKAAMADMHKARDIESDVILSLTSLRGDLQLKIKEIKNLSGDFKNTAEKEMEATRRAVKMLQEGLGQNELDPALTVGKQDPYLLRLAVDRQVWKQLEEENYLHQAYINLENSGRELESIVVGEIQKAYSAYGKILTMEAGGAFSAVDALRTGPLMMPKDQEWGAFVEQDDQFVNPSVPIRSAEHVHYPGQDHPSCQEIKAGLLERKSKYLKSYTAGWYVLSSTHLHEFKSADKGQAPIMSLYLPEQKLGAHSAEGGASNKFVLKGRQTGAMHRGHTWVFRAESHDTMLAWYEDIKILTERAPEDRSTSVRGHMRSLSQSSRRSTSSDGVDEDDEEPFSANAAINVGQAPRQKHHSQKPQDPNRRLQPPGGRFPSDIHVIAHRDLLAPHSPSSVSSGEKEPSSELATTGAASAGPLSATQDFDTLAGSSVVPTWPAQGEHVARTRGGQLGYGGTDQTRIDDVHSHAALVTQDALEAGVNPYRNESWGGAEAHHPILAGQALAAPTGAASSHDLLMGSEARPSPQQTRQHPVGSATHGSITGSGGDMQPECKRDVEMLENVTSGPECGILEIGLASLTTSAVNLSDDGIACNMDYEHQTRPGPGHRSDTGGLSGLHVPGEYPKPSPML